MCAALPVLGLAVVATETGLAGPASAAGNVPGAPTSVSATATPAAASVSFTAPSDNGSPITGYTVTAADLTHSANGGETGTGSASPISVTGLTDGDAYTFTVTATNTNGTGPASAPSNPVIPIPIVNSLSGDAYGLQSTGLIPITATPSVALPNSGDGGGPFTATDVSAGVPGVLGAGVLSATTQGSDVNTLSGNSSSSAQVANVNLLAGALTIGAITSSCSSNAGGSAGAVTVANIDVDGVPQNQIPSNVPPNTAITVPGVLSVTLNAETHVDQPGDTAITVTGLKITLLGTTDVINIAEADCDAEGPAVEAPPSVTGLNPNSGPTAGGTSVTITGYDFYDVSGVSFGTNPAQSFTVVSPTEIIAVSPPGNPGPVDVTITTAYGTSITSPLDVFTYFAPPVISTLTPSEGPTTGGTSVTISGTGLTGGTVTIDGNPVTAICTADSCTFTTPPGTVGPVPVVVTTPGGTSNTLTYTYVAVPALTSLTPDEGPTTGGTSVTISGTGLTDGTVTINGNPVTAICTADSCTFTTPPATAGPVPVVVTTPGGGASNTLTYTYVAVPALTSLTPDEGPTTGGTTVTITGTGLTGGTVTIDGNPVTAICTADSCTFTTPPGTVGPVPVVVTTPGGGASNTLTYTYVAVPSLTSLKPDEGPTKGGTSVTISGTSLSDGTVTLGGGTVAATCTADSCTFSTPAHAAGPVPVIVTTPGGGASNTLTYTYIPGPALLSLKPNEGPTAGGTRVTISGTDLTGGSVTIGGASVQSTCSPSACTFTTPRHTAGPVHVIVTTPGGASNPLTYTYVGQPSISSVRPPSGPTTGGTHVTVRGANLAGARVTIAGINVVATCTENACTFITPPHAAGEVAVAAASVGGSAHGPFTYVPVPVRPTVTGVNPAKGPSYGGTRVTVTGTGFATAAGATTITFAGVDATDVSCSSSHHCTVTDPIGLGTVFVQATVKGLTSTPNRHARFMYIAGYYLLSSGGTVYPFGFAVDHGSVPPSDLNSPAVSIAFDPGTHGYWVAEKSGKVVGFDAPTFSEAPGHGGPSDIVAIATTPSGNGYWLVSATGKVYPYGAAGYFGEVDMALNKPAIGISPTADGAGYFILAGDGGIFNYGDAKFHGSTGSLTGKSAPIVAMAVDRHTGGYWLTASDGTVYAFDAPFLGDMHGKHLNKPVLGIVGAPNGDGYYLVAADGGVFSFGDVNFFGSLGSDRLSDIVSMAFED
jgi:hypothetical protein